MHRSQFDIAPGLRASPNIDTPLVRRLSRKRVLAQQSDRLRGLRTPQESRLNSIEPPRSAWNQRVLNHHGWPLSTL